jgi:hypothetical protein
VSINFSALGKLRQEDLQFKASLGYIARPFLTKMEEKEEREKEEGERGRKKKIGAVAAEDIGKIAV